MMSIAFTLQKEKDKIIAELKSQLKDMEKNSSELVSQAKLEKDNLEGELLKLEREVAVDNETISGLKTEIKEAKEKVRHFPLTEVTRHTNFRFYLLI